MKRLSVSLIMTVICATGCTTSKPVKPSQIPVEVKKLVQQRQACLKIQLKYANNQWVTPTEQTFLQGCGNVTLAREFRMMREKYQYNPTVTDYLDRYADFD